MNYKILLKVINEHYNKLESSDIWDRIYFDTINRWGKLENIKKEDAEMMLKFLNVWKCRIDKKILPKLYQALLKTRGNFKLLKDKNLENVSLEEIKRIISSIFNNLKLKRINATAISKIMHIINPNLFVMWDEEIRKGYGFYNNSVGYMNFLKKMQVEIQEILVTFCKEHKINGGQAEERIYRMCHNDKRTLLKLIDEYNYTIFTRKKLEQINLKS